MDMNIYTTDEVPWCPQYVSLSPSYSSQVSAETPVGRQGILRTLDQQPEQPDR